MKNLFTLLLVSYVWTCMAQNTQEQKLIGINIKEISEYYEVNEKNEIEKDTLFLAKAGFRIDPSYNHREIVGEDKKVYVVFKFPNYNKQSKQITPPAKSLITASSEGVNTSPTVVYLNSTRIDSTVTPATDSTPRQVTYDTVALYNGKTLAIERKTYEGLKKKNRYKIWFRNINLSYGALTIPFKLRPSFMKNDSTHIPAILTTETSIGPFIGLFSRISREEEFYWGITASIGASFIDVNTNNTFGTRPEDASNLSVGISWSVGTMFRLENFTIGYVLGMDHSYESEADWYYNGKLWHSFSIGYNFTRPLKRDGNTTN